MAVMAPQAVPAAAAAPSHAPQVPQDVRFQFTESVRAVPTPVVPHAVHELHTTAVAQSHPSGITEEVATPQAPQAVPAVAPEAFPPTHPPLAMAIT